MSKVKVNKKIIKNEEKNIESVERQKDDMKTMPLDRPKLVRTKKVIIEKEIEEEEEQEEELFEKKNVVHIF